ncbi:MAG: chemotaxis protein methyltransferase CheR [Marinoscillum sp.]|jgi:chemotaxis protein methyltransferase CheR
MTFINVTSITTKEFSRFSQFIYDYAGIKLSPVKKIMVGNRLSKRLNYYQLDTFTQYYDLVMSKEYPNELQTMVDILTTNETYFFREPQHFEYLKDNVIKNFKGSKFRIWSAASSSGEEAYSLAMLLSENLPNITWEVIGSDLSKTVLAKAQLGIYPMSRLELLDNKLMKKYCLRGVRSHEGTFRIDEKLRERTHFGQVNLIEPITANIGTFDVIFLRNVLIYFDTQTKKSVVERIISKLKPGGLFFISHAETLSQVTDMLEMIQPSIYMKK